MKKQIEFLVIFGRILRSQILIFVRNDFEASYSKYI